MTDGGYRDAARSVCCSATLGGRRACFIVGSTARGPAKPQRPDRAQRAKRGTTAQKNEGRSKLDANLGNQRQEREGEGREQETTECAPPGRPPRGNAGPDGASTQGREDAGERQAIQCPHAAPGGCKRRYEAEDVTKTSHPVEAHTAVSYTVEAEDRAPDRPGDTPEEGDNGGSS